VAAFALEEGACCIYLHVLSSNEPALSLYRKNGMQYILRKTKIAVDGTLFTMQAMTLRTTQLDTACGVSVTDAMAISGYEEQLSLPDYYQLGPSTADALLLTRMLVPQATSLFSQYVVLAWESLFQELISWSTELCLETRDLSIGQ
jgi:ribosomal protein S18 acetylase RimI-like enzyme